MWIDKLFKLFLTTALLLQIPLQAAEKELPEKMLRIMRQPKYEHATWGIYVKDAETGKVLYDLNSDKMFLPASTTKLFTTAALLHAYGDDYRFKTPVYAFGPIKNGHLDGQLILVAQGDLTMGGRQINDTIQFTKLDHINANDVPGVILTPQDPLNGLKQLAKQLSEKGIKEVRGDVLIDDRLFETVEKRGLQVSPIMINENLIDIIINPSEIGKAAEISWRPKVPGYAVVNEVKTVSKGDAASIQITSDEIGRKILVKGKIPEGQKDLIRTFAVKDPKHFARAAFIQSLREQGIAVILDDKPAPLPLKKEFRELEPMAVWTSAPLTEYVKLILKVSHNLGADLVPMLLAVKEGETSFDEGMQELGSFVTDQVKIPYDAFVFIDGAGGDDNRLTPRSEVELLEYMRKLPKDRFKAYYNALPILGQDGSLADFGKTTGAVGKVRAKPGTGIAFNLAVYKFFLTSQALAGYIEAKNGHLIEFMLAVNNGKMPAVNDIFPILKT